MSYHILYFFDSCQSFCVGDFIFSLHFFRNIFAIPIGYHIIFPLYFDYLDFFAITRIRKETASTLVGIGFLIIKTFEGSLPSHWLAFFTPYFLATMRY